jgi:hypothetical protein
MVQKKKTTKKQLKQKQRQYQKQSVVVNEYGKRRRRTAGKKLNVWNGNVGSFAPQLIQSIPFNTALKRCRSVEHFNGQQNRIFRARSGTAFMNEEREKNVANNNKGRRG